VIDALLDYLGFRWGGTAAVGVGRRIGSWIGYWQEMPSVHFITNLRKTSVQALHQVRVVELDEE
jgi:hypothetical protein